MRAGRLRHRLVLQSKTYITDAYGGYEVAWVTQATVWGGIEPLGGRELFAQSQVQSEAEARIVLRPYSGIDETWRITHGGKYYDITEVIKPNTRSGMLTLMCRQGVSEDVDAAEDTTYYVVNNGVNVVNNGIQVIHTP